jgi:hypothetical protein
MDVCDLRTVVYELRAAARAGRLGESTGVGRGGGAGVIHHVTHCYTRAAGPSAGFNRSRGGVSCWQGHSLEFYWFERPPGDATQCYKRGIREDSRRAAMGLGE